MIAAKLEDAILKRISKIPIVESLQMRVLNFDDGNNHVAVAQVNYIILDNLNPA